MTNEDIIKALKCCKHESIETCRDCPMLYTHEFDDVDDFDCGKYLYERAIGIINSQKKMIKLEKEIINAKDKCIEAKSSELTRLSELIDSLRKCIEENKEGLTMMYEMAIGAKQKAYELFAENLKQRQYLDKDNNAVISVLDINEVLKEMRNEDE